MAAEHADHLDYDDGWLPDTFGLPRAGAVDNLVLALEGRGLPAEAARAIARAAVRPEDVRKKLTDPVELRVQGATLLIVETRLWSAGILPHSANPREYGRDDYPLAGRPPVKSLAWFQPVSNSNGSAELQLKVDKPEDLVERLNQAEGWLTRHNSLVDDLRIEGVLQPLTVAPMTVKHRSGVPDVTFLIAADGSSRTSAVHQVLGYSPVDLVYGLAADERRFRQRVNAHIGLLQKQGWDGLSDAERAQIRVLTVPARVVVGFRADPRANIAFHVALRNLIGLMHISPPKPYSAAAENEAKADAVLEALARPLKTRPALITKQQQAWLGAHLTPDHVVESGFPEAPDLRAADIIRTTLAGGPATARRVNDGIRALTARQQPKREDRVDIAVELILRATDRSDSKYISSRRAVLQRAYRLPEIDHLSSDEQLEGMSRQSLTLEQLRDRALEELRRGEGNNSRLAVAQTELAVKAAYYMAIAEPMALRREVFGGSEDEDVRSPAVVLRAMLSVPRGIVQAYHIVRAGRRGEPLLEVDESGDNVLASGECRKLSDAVIRHQYNGESIRVVNSGYPAASSQWGVIARDIGELESAVRRMANVPYESGSEQSLVSRVGWNREQVAHERLRLDAISFALASWGHQYQEAQATVESVVDERS